MSQSSSTLSAMTDMIASPSKAFAFLDKNPKSFWVPFLTNIILGVAMVVMYFSMVDPDWFMGQMEAAAAMSGQDLPEEAKAFLTPGVIMPMAAASVAIFTVVITLVAAVYFMIIDKMSSSDERGYGYWFSFVAWAGVPAILATLVSIGYMMFVGDNQTPIEDSVFYSLNALVTNYPVGHSAQGWANAITPFLFWGLALMVMGLKQLTGRSTGSAAVAVLVPYTVIFGVWGFMAL